MRTSSRIHQRFMALVLASALGCAAVGLTAAPAAAAMPAPTDLKTANQPCATTAPGPYLSLTNTEPVVLHGTFSRTGESRGLQADFQVWDSTDPEHPQQWLRGIGESSNEVFVHLNDESQQLDGVTYAWRVRILDGAEASPWSGTCYFTVDRSGGPAPTVTSTDYPAGDWTNASGGIGIPGAFTVTSAANDTVRYQYNFDSEPDPVVFTVEAEEVGGPASFHWTPTYPGSRTLTVYAIDRAGNRSAAARYTFSVRETRPTISSSAYPSFGSNLIYNVGVPGAFEFRARLTETASFVWRIDGDGPSGTVAADASGWTTAMIAPARAGQQTLYVQSVTHDGTVHAPGTYRFHVDNGPIVTGDTDQTVVVGSSLTFHLAPRAPDVEEYLYWPVHYTARPVEKSTVPARADGTADLVWTAMESGVRSLQIQSRSADGTLSEPRSVAVSVNGANPTVIRTSGVEPGTFTFTASTRMVNPVEYVAVFNNDEATTLVVPAAADGSATFTFRSPIHGQNYVSVFARNAAGARTNTGIAWWSYTNRPRITSTAFPQGGSGRLAPGTFEFKANMTGTTAFEYSMNSGPYVTIAARPDGTATLDWTPWETGPHYLVVRSVTASGDRSMSIGYSFTVHDATTTPVYPATVPAGGVRSLTIEGTSLHNQYQVQVIPSTGEPLTARVTGVSADRTKITVSVDLTSTATGLATVSLWSPGSGDPLILANAFTIAPPPPLRVIKPPTIRGTVAVGSTVTAIPGKWLPTATAYQYQWSADGTAIPGATGDTLTIPTALAGKELTVTVTASQSGYTPTKATSFIAVVGGGEATRTTTQPKTADIAKVNTTGSAARTIETNNDAGPTTTNTYRFEWRINGKLIRGIVRAQL